MVLITKQDFDEWLISPVTKKFFKVLEEEREEMKEILVNGNPEFPDIVKGRCQAIALITSVTYEEMFHERNAGRVGEIEES